MSILTKAFDVDEFGAFEQLLGCKLKDDETVDEYCASINEISRRVENLSLCAFYNGLPTDVKREIK